jgi:hypothetical protein
MKIGLLGRGAFLFYSCRKIRPNKKGREVSTLALFKLFTSNGQQ